MPQQCTIDRIKDVLSELQSLLDDNNEQGPNKKPVEEKTPSNNGQELVEWRRPSKNEQEPVEKKRPSSLFGWVTGSVKKRFKGKKETSNHGSDSGGGSQGGSRQSRLNMGKEEVDADLEKLRLQSDIHQMKAAFENLTHFQSTISKSLETDVPSNKLKVILEKTQYGKSRARDLKDIRRKVLNLKGQIPSLLKKQSSIGLSITDSQTTEENGQMTEIVETGSDISLPGLHVSNGFKETLAFEEVMEKFEALEFTKMLCLLSFAVFPENKEVKRTMLMYWWIGEGFICDEDSENEVTKILDEFSREGLLEPVEDETKLKSSGYKMEPHVHSAVIYLARRMELFNLYSSGKLKMQKSKKENVCLVKGSSLQPKTSIQEPKTLRSVFNSSERYPDFTFKWFPRLESLKVLYLGRWERTAKRHIEVESTDFLKDMKSLKSLRLASFQGISRIENLKDLVCSLPKLVILDLRACYNLEALPDDIGSLESLIYLDVSECYMLDRMPAGIAGLRKLQVLKGFVISQSDDEKNCVKKLEDLRKLSITVNKYNFKVEDFMESLSGLKQLNSLKIAWGARFPDEDRKVEEIELTDESMENEETTNQEKEKQQEDDHVHKKGQTSQEKEGDGVSSKNEQGKKRDEVKAESMKSDKDVEGEKKVSPSAEPTEKIQKKPEDQKGESKVDGDGDKGKADIEEGKKQDEVEAEKSKPDNGVEGVRKASPSREPTEMKPDDKSKTEKEANGDKGKKQDEVEAEKSKSGGVEGVTKASPSREPTEMKPDDKSKMEKEANGDKGKKQDEVDAEKSKSDNGVEGVKKASPSSESTNTIENKPDGEKEKTNLEEGKKKDEVKAESSKPDKLIEGGEKTGPSKESEDTVKSKPDDHQRGDKQEEKGDGEKEKANLEEGKNKDEVKAESSKPDKLIEGDEKTSPSKESEDNVKSKLEDHKENSKVQEKGDGEKIKAALKKPEGGEAKTQKSDKNKLDHKVSFSEEPRAPVQKQPDDMEKENHETASTSRSKKAATKESGSRLARLFTIKRHETRKPGKEGQEDSGKDTSKLPPSLKKLELECFPYKKPPIWLNPKTLDNLEKLSIKGGKLRRFSDEPKTAENKCGVQILRLKYLHEFKAEWKDLKTLFPHLKLLEKYKCPEVAFCPTDGNGVWRLEP